MLPNDVVRRLRLACRSKDMPIGFEMALLRTQVVGDE